MPARSNNDSPARLVQRPAAAGSSTRRKTFVLPIDRLHPVVRIAHHSSGPLNIARRIIVDHEIVLLTAGRCTLHLPDQSQDLCAGDLVLLRPFVAHSFSSGPGDGCAHLAIHFDPAPDMPPRGDRLDRRKPYAVRLSHGVDLPRTVRLPAASRLLSELPAIVRAWRAPSPLTALDVSSRLTRVLLTLIDLQTASRGRLAAGPSHRQRPGSTARRPGRSFTDTLNRARLQTAADHARAHLTDGLCAADLARVAGLSPAHFARLFRRWAGQRPTQFLLELRIDAARRLLTDPALSVKQVAVRVGFPDPYHFSRTFRRIDGLSPSEFRAAALAHHTDPS